MPLTVAGNQTSLITVKNTVNFSPGVVLKINVKLKTPCIVFKKLLKN